MIHYICCHGEIRKIFIQITFLSSTKCNRQMDQHLKGSTCTSAQFDQGLHWLLNYLAGIRLFLACISTHLFLWWGFTAQSTQWGMNTFILKNLRKSNYNYSISHNHTCSHTNKHTHTYHFWFESEKFQEVYYYIIIIIVNLFLLTQHDLNVDWAIKPQLKILYLFIIILQHVPSR